MFTNTISVNSSVVAGFPDLVRYHWVNLILGAFCLVINLFLITIFLSHKGFRHRFTLLIQLCCADIINSVAIVFTGINRIHLYSTAYSTKSLPVRNTWECALETWLILKLIGDLLIPTSTLWMGVERFIAIKFPLIYRFYVDGKATKYVLIPVSSVIFVAGAIVIALTMAYSDQKETNFYCGRKAAFGDSYGTFIYLNNIVCNLISTMLNALAYTRAAQMAKEQPRMQRQLSVIRYYLLISVLSTVFVSFPNAIALFQLYVRTVPDAISKPAYWMQTATSGIHFFVYMSLNQDIRGRALFLLQKSSKYDNSRIENEAEKILNNNEDPEENGYKMADGLLPTPRAV